MSLTVTYEQMGKGKYVIHPAGSLNSSTYRILEEQVEAILPLAPAILVLDLARLDYMSSAGIRVILKTRDALKKHQGRLMFMHLQPQIKKVFDIINAIPSMQIFGSIEELDEYLDVMQRS